MSCLTDEKGGMEGDGPERLACPARCTWRCARTRSGWGCGNRGSSASSRGSASSKDGCGVSSTDVPAPAPLRQRCPRRCHLSNNINTLARRIFSPCQPAANTFSSYACVNEDIGQPSLKKQKTLNRKKSDRARVVTTPHPATHPLTPTYSVYRLKCPRLLHPTNHPPTGKEMSARRCSDLTCHKSNLADAKCFRVVELNEATHPPTDSTRASSAKAQGCIYKRAENIYAATSQSCRERKKNRTKNELRMTFGDFDTWPPLPPPPLARATLAATSKRRKSEQKE